MQPVSSRIWTRVAVSISYDDNHYTTGTCIKYMIISHADLDLWRLESSLQHVNCLTSDTDDPFIGVNTLVGPVPLLYEHTGFPSP